MSAREASTPNASSDVDTLRMALKAVAAGDQAALQTIYERTSAKLFGICLRISGDRMEAEDALQEVYVSLWRRAHRYDPARSSPISWLAIFARNRAIDRLRSSTRLRGAAEIGEAAEVPDGSPGAFELVAGEQERQRLAGCIDLLEERQRSAIRSAFFDGVTYAELAARGGTPLGTMKSWVRRGLAQLKSCLDQ